MSRRAARAIALQMLFQIDVGHNTLTEARLTWEEACLPKNEIANEDCLYHLSEDAANFSWQLVTGVEEEKEKIDAVLKETSLQWDIERLANVDRSILRLGIYEMLFREDIPASVTINEAIELAKLFGTEESGSFINGVLDSVRKKYITKNQMAE